MKLTPLLVAAALVTAGGAGVYAFAQTLTQHTTAAAQAEQPGALEALRRYVMDFGGTEQAFNNAYWNNHEPGIYVEARTGEPLFASSDKFDSGSGWPSFTRPINRESLQTRTDRSAGMTRTEVRSSTGAHLGHVFNDGPRAQGGQRFCINSCAMRFIPRDRMAAEGYGQYLPLVDGTAETAARR